MENRHAQRVPGSLAGQRGDGLRPIGSVIFWTVFRAQMNNLARGRRLAIVPPAALVIAGLAALDALAHLI